MIGLNWGLANLLIENVLRITSCTTYENSAKYRPHRPHDEQSADLQVFDAVGTMPIIDRQRMVTDRHRKYRARIDRTVIRIFAGLSPW